MLKRPKGLRKPDCYFFFAIFYARMIAEDEIVREFSGALQTQLAVFICLEIFTTIQELPILNFFITIRQLIHIYTLQICKLFLL